MLVLAAIFFIPLLLSLSAAQALVESIDPDELTSMGVATPTLKYGTYSIPAHQTRRVWWAVFWGALGTASRRRTRRL